MVMFKARFAPSDKPAAIDDPKPADRKPKEAPPGKERGPQAPVELPGQSGPPERAGWSTDKEPVW
jgi:hypothetical protein